MQRTIHRQKSSTYWVSNYAIELGTANISVLYFPT